MSSDWGQSPINLDTEAATYLGLGSGAVVDVPETRSNISEAFLVVNNGYNLLVYISGSWKVTLNNKTKNYHNVDSFNFHWESVNSRGSEHTVDNASFPLEMQILTYSSMFRDTFEAAKYPGGTAIISVLFQMTANQSESSLSKMGNLLSAIDNLTAFGSSALVSYLKPMSYCLKTGMSSSANWVLSLFHPAEGIFSER
ncbi:unnamed protein product [Dibothriocephalus latus]|uniref:carbonic anhydrase n=1 Tax=Dibothriocephalus latus TaxID=60516 RepID=A0A3P7LBP1_DIBLA|nr:unnamed protein product [Dibothriocephalus latus]